MPINALQVRLVLILFFGFFATSSPAWATTGRDGAVDAAQAGDRPPRYAARAHTVMRHIQDSFYRPSRGTYRLKQGEPTAADMWACGVIFPALVGGTRHMPGTYQPLLHRFFNAMDRYWDDDAPIPGYEPFPIPRGRDTADKYYDDNAWMAITFIEAYELTGDRAYLDRAIQTQRFVLSGEDDVLGGGIWWHEKRNDNTKNTCSNAPAAVACLLIARNAPTQRDAMIAKARELVAWTNDTLQDPEDGLFYDRIKADTKRVIRGKLTYNTALMIRANLGLYRATGEPGFLEEAKRLGDAAQAFVSRRTGAYRNAFKFSHLLIEADVELWRATGDRAYLERARASTDWLYRRWQREPDDELINNAAVARALWLMADTQDDHAMAFWRRVEQVPPGPEGGGPQHGVQPR